MKFILALFLLSQSAFAIDVGDGSDGPCNITGGGPTQITSARRTYQCTTLNIDANLNDFSGSSVPGSNGNPVVIKVQGNVTVAFGVTIDLSGQAGDKGNLGAVVNGGRAGAGGGAGGNSTATIGNNGNGSRPGSGGNFAPRSGGVGASAYGGGGGGGSYQTTGTAPVDGEDNGTPISAGVNGLTFGPESAFDSSFSGGSGGAAGGSGVDNTAQLWYGSSGGGAGGALRIIAGGNIVVDGNIFSDGGAGGGDGTVTSSGGGGGGSGGAIWLQAGGNLTISATATLHTNGGAGGTNDGFNGAGGAGGIGRIRLDDGNGSITNLGSVSPAPYTTTFIPSPLVTGTDAMRSYTSTVSCASVALNDHEKPFNNLVNLVLGIAVVALAHFVASRRSKV